MEKSENSNKSIGKIIGELSRAVHVYFKHELDQYSIGHAQIRTLVFLSENEGASSLDLSRHFNCDKSSVTSQIKKLLEHGYIERKPNSKDARIMELYITDKTRKILKPMKRVFLSWTEALLEGFSEKEKNEIFNYMERMKSNAHRKLSEIKETNEE